MKKIWKNIKRIIFPKPKEILIKPNNKECHHHDFIKYPSIKANEHCKSCTLDICYMCSNKHLTQQCIVECIFNFN